MHPEPTPVDPFHEFARWQRQAREAGDPMSDRFVLATVDSSGQPRARMLSYRPGPNGEFRFYTHHESAKGHELAREPRVAALFYFHDHGRQVRLEGSAERVPESVSDAHFASRSIAHRVTTLLSPQSRPIDSLREITEAHAARLAEYAEGALPLERPPTWGGFELVVHRIELWQRIGQRLAERRTFSRRDPSQHEDRWTEQLLAP